MIPTIEWSGNQVRMIDQRKIPGKIEWFTCENYKDVIRGIKEMVVRGAPAIGIAASMGMALGARTIKTESYDQFVDHFNEIADEMREARPTAVNLGWAINRMSDLLEESEDLSVDEIKDVLLKESQKVLDEDIEINRKMGSHGEKLIPKNATILTHCNAGSLATGGYGTALGVIRASHEAGKNINVLADETRPWLQGLRLTAFELMEDDIPVSVITDNAAGSFMRNKKVDIVITGADRIAANGDVANKIGTYQIAVLAKENRIPFYIAAPLSTIDRTIRNGDMIPIEERDPSEISTFGDQQIGPLNVKGLNPAFDITLAKYISAIITEVGVIRPPYRSEIRKAFVK